MCDRDFKGLKEFTVFNKKIFQVCLTKFYIRLWALNLQRSSGGGQVLMLPLWYLHFTENGNLNMENMLSMIPGIYIYIYIISIISYL